MSEENKAPNEPQTPWMPPKERLYSKIKISVKTLDIIIWCIGILAVILIIVGAMNGTA